MLPIVMPLSLGTVHLPTAMQSLGSVWCEMLWVTKCLMATDVKGRIALDTLQMDYLLAMLGSPKTSAAVRTAVQASTSAASRLHAC